jgi:replication-associated recombination protein RarA
MINFNKTPENWSDKYRPTNLDELILPKNMMMYFKNYMKGGNHQPIVLFGRPGTGKTITASIISGKESVIIDCRNPDDVKSLRETLSSATSVTMFEDRRTIIIDDCENLSSSVKHSLRGIDRLTGFNDFILTTNRIDLLDAPLRSRLTEWCFDFSLDEESKELILARLEHICKNESIVAPDRSSLMFLIKKHYPDLRKMIGELQKIILSRVN